MLKESQNRKEKKRKEKIWLQRNNKMKYLRMEHWNEKNEKKKKHNQNNLEVKDVLYFYLFRTILNSMHKNYVCVLSKQKEEWKWLSMQSIALHRIIQYIIISACGAMDHRSRSVNNNRFFSSTVINFYCRPPNQREVKNHWQEIEINEYQLILCVLFLCNLPFECMAALNVISTFYMHQIIMCITYMWPAACVVNAFLT